MPSPLAEAFLMGILNGCYETPSKIYFRKNTEGITAFKKSLYRPFCSPAKMVCKAFSSASFTVAQIA